MRVYGSLHIPVCVWGGGVSPEAEFQRGSNKEEGHNISKIQANVYVWHQKSMTELNPWNAIK